MSRNCLCSSSSSFILTVRTWVTGPSWFLEWCDLPHIFSTSLSTCFFTFKVQFRTKEASCVRCVTPCKNQDMSSQLWIKWPRWQRMYRLIFLFFFILSFLSSSFVSYCCCLPFLVLHLLYPSPTISFSVLCVHGFHPWRLLVGSKPVVLLVPPDGAGFSKQSNPHIRGRSGDTLLRLIHPKEHTGLSAGGEGSDQRCQTALCHCGLTNSQWWVEMCVFSTRFQWQHRKCTVESVKRILLCFTFTWTFFGMCLYVEFPPVCVEKQTFFLSFVFVQINKNLCIKYTLYYKNAAICLFIN